MADVTSELLKTQLRPLRLPTGVREFEKPTRDAAATDRTFAQSLLRLTEMELAARAANAVTSRIKGAGFPVEKDFDTHDFSVMPQLSKPKVLELARCEWIAQKANCLLPGGQSWSWENAHRGGMGLGGMSCGSSGALLHGGRTGGPIGEGAGAIHAGPLPDPARSSSAIDLRRAGMRHDEPRRRRPSVPGVRRSL
jgi:hypothetical protein